MHISSIASQTPDHHASRMGGLSERCGRLQQPWSDGIHETGALHLTPRFPGDGLEADRSIFDEPARHHTCDYHSTTSHTAATGKHTKPK